MYRLHRWAEIVIAIYTKYTAASTYGHLRSTHGHDRGKIHFAKYGGRERKQNERDSQDNEFDTIKLWWKFLPILIHIWCNRRINYRTLGIWQRRHFPRTKSSSFKIHLIHDRHSDVPNRSNPHEHGHQHFILKRQSCKLRGLHLRHLTHADLLVVHHNWYQWKVSHLHVLLVTTDSHMLLGGSVGHIPNF